MISLSAGGALVDATQHPVGFLCRSSTLSTHIEIIIHQDHQVPFHRAAPQQSRFLFSWVMFSQVQDHVYLSNFIGFLVAHSFSLSRSSCRVALPLSLLPSTNSARVHLVPSYGSLRKTLNTVGPNSNPFGTPLVTGFLFEELFTTTLWVLPVSSPLTTGTTCQDP